MELIGREGVPLHRGNGEGTPRHLTNVCLGVEERSSVNFIQFTNNSLNKVAFIFERKFCCNLFFVVMREVLSEPVLPR